MQLCISQFSYENLFHQILTCKLKGGGGDVQPAFPLSL